ncbi:MAG: transglycosylase SLT domain-containing protein [Myxococcota bacterium]
MPRRAAFFIIFVLLSGPTTTLGQGIETAMPPAFCANAECARAAQHEAAGEFVEAAKAWERAIPKTRSPQNEVWQLRVDLLTKAATAWERAGRDRAAGATYWKASRAADTLQPFLAFKAAESFARQSAEDEELMRAALESSGFEHPFPRRALVEARLRSTLEGDLPEVEVADTALLSAETNEEACEWLSTLVADAEASKRRTTLANLVYGRCLPELIADDFRVKPNDLARFRRAAQWYGAVRFPESREELSKVDFDKLDATNKCDARFLLGRTLYRLRKRNEALQTYVRVIDECSAEVAEDSRVRSLYAAGKRYYRLNRYDKAHEYYEQLLEEFPDRSHADDAILYLARVARAKGQRDEQKALLDRALQEYSDGDMVHEIAWEYVEPTVKKQDWKTLLTELESLDLPDHDDQYFSQGRLGYLEGLAHSELGHKKKAVAAWQRTWARYPFSFYGYASHQRVIDHGESPQSLDVGDEGWVADWFSDEPWTRSAPGRLARLGLFTHAADAQEARGTDSAEDAWRLAYLEHRSGRYELSHNIIRRGIEGRPWTGRARGRLLRWTIAWPNPFAEQIGNAVELERRQADDEYVHPGLAAAIMREESSFIEDVESWAGALGLMQLMPATALDHDADIEGEATPDKLKTAEVNVRVGVDHIYSLARRFDSHPVVMVAAYNAGGGAASSWLDGDEDIALWVEDIPYDQTRNYTKRVIGSYAAYQWLSGLRELDERVGDAPPAR